MKHISPNSHFYTYTFIPHLPRHTRLQNTIKLAEVKIAADTRETEKSMEKRHVFANKLYVAEMNRERELQKKLDIIRKHVGLNKTTQTYHIIRIQSVKTIITSNLLSYVSPNHFECTYIINLATRLI